MTAAAPRPDPAPVVRAGLSTAAKLALAALLLGGAFGAMHALAPTAESPLAFSYQPRPLALTGAAPAGPDWAADAARAAATLAAPADADARAARETVDAFLDEVGRGDFGAAWARFDPADRENASESVWTAEQRIWAEIGAQGGAPAARPTLQRVAAYPVGTDRLLAYVDVSAAGARGLPLAVETARRDGRWWIVKASPLWAGGSPLQLRAADRVGLDWLRYPLRLAPLADDLALMAKVAAYRAPDGAALADVAPDERPLVAAENPLYHPAQLAPGVRASWTPAGGAQATRAALQSAWTEPLREQGWEAVPSPLRLRLVSAAGSGELETAPFGGAADAPVRRVTLHLSESSGAVPDPTAALAYRRKLAEIGAQADAAVAGLPAAPGTRLLPSPAEASGQVASGGGEIAAAAFYYAFDRGNLQPADLRTFYAAVLSNAGWQRERGGSDVGFRSADGAARIYVAGFEDTPLRALAGYPLNPARFVLVYLAGKP